MKNNPNFSYKVYTHVNRETQEIASFYYLGNMFETMEEFKLLLEMINRVNFKKKVEKYPLMFPEYAIVDLKRLKIDAIDEDEIKLWSNFEIVNLALKESAGFKTEFALLKNLNNQKVYPFKFNLYYNLAKGVFYIHRVVEPFPFIESQPLVTFASMEQLEKTLMENQTKTNTPPDESIVTPFKPGAYHANLKTGEDIEYVEIQNEYLDEIVEWSNRCVTKVRHSDTTSAIVSPNRLKIVEKEGLYTYGDGDYLVKHEGGYIKGYIRNDFFKYLKEQEMPQEKEIIEKFVEESKQYGIVDREKSTPIDNYDNDLFELSVLVHNFESTPAELVGTGNLRERFVIHVDFATYSRLLAGASNLDQSCCYSTTGQIPLKVRGFDVERSNLVKGKAIVEKR